MTIDFCCPCGKAYSVAEELAGKRTRCPKCSTLIIVPELEPVDIVEEIVSDFDVVEDDEPAMAEVKASGPPEISENALAYKTTISSTTALRIVRVGKELLFLEAGPYFKELDADHADQAAYRGGSGDGGITGAAISGALGAMEQMREEEKKKKAEKRWAKLDKMTADELRREVTASNVNFRAKASELSEVVFDSTSRFKDANRPAGEVPGKVQFTHDVLGSVKLYFTKVFELKKAVYLFVDILGKKDVEVNLPIRKKRRS